ncbi:MAG: HAMP domain-containing protein [Bacteroidetes bacterium]|nr:HAMP domain-containing protein [Bacteroidota bacterium]
MRKISLSEKLILYFLFLGLGTIFIIGFYSFSSTRDALIDRTFDQLTSLRIAKKNQVEIFFQDRTREMNLLSGLEDTREILRMLGKAPEKDCETSLKTYLKKYKPLTGYFTTVRIQSANGRFMKGTIAGSGIEQGRIEPNGENSQSSLIIHDEIVDPVSGNVRLFIEAPIFNDQQQPAGRIVLELPADEINTIMLNNDPKSGLGLTGETYLVGSDFKIRSSSRFIPNSILKTTVHTQPIMSAIRGEEGHIITTDYRSIMVLSSYSSLKIPGLEWFILAEIDQKEAMVPIYRMRNSIMLLSMLISVIFFVFVFMISKRITKPIIQLKEAALKVGKGQYDIDIPVRSNDEIGALTETFNSMSVQIKEKNHELQMERTGRLRSVIDAGEKERQRLSREIHDGIGQSLIAHKLRLESLLYMEDADVKEQIRILKEQFNVTIDEIRRISNNLMPSVLEVFGITLALKNLCEETEENGGPEILFQSTGELENISTKTKTYIYRIAQEALNNIVKHSGAKEVTFTLSRSKDMITFILRDDGRGFDVEDAAFEKGNGLHNMRERVTLMQGTINLVSSEGEGTTLIINIPVL